MDERLKKALYYLGIIAAAYIFLRYLLPFLFKLLGWVIGTVFSIIIWVIFGVIVVLCVSYIINLIKTR